MSNAPKASSNFLQLSGDKQTHDRADDGTEFWPLFLGYHFKITDSLLVLFNALLYLVTYLLVRSTEKLWEAGEKQIAVARESADAAMLSAKAADLSAKVAISQQMPIVLVDAIEIQTTHDRENSANIFGNFYLSVIFKNVGKSQAFVIKKCVNIKVSETLPDEPQYLGVVDARPGEVMHPDQNYEQLPHPFDEALTAANLTNEIWARKTNFWVYGFLQYGDILANQHVVGFCKRWMQSFAVGRTAGQFVGDGPARYTYNK